ncbi:MAG: membrane protease subunit HflC [Hyphomicrobiaceae bacterium]
MNRVFIVLGLALIAVSVFWRSLFFSVGEWQSAVVLQFGKPIRTVSEPGLNWRIPGVQNVIYFEKRLLEYDAAPKEVITKDKQQLSVDNFARWRITNPLGFYRSVRTESQAQSRLDDIIYSALREVVAQKTLSDVVSGDRASLVDYIRIESNKKAEAFGIEIVDVRIKRTELPAKNELSVFNRMRSERERQAKGFRAEGDEEARKIRSMAERTRSVLLAEATREAELLRGEGDSNAISTYAKAYEEDPEFYAFQRTLDAYERTLGSGTTLVMTPRSEFLKGLMGTP